MMLRPVGPLRRLATANLAAAAPSAKTAAKKSASPAAAQGPPKDPTVLYVAPTGVNSAYDVLSAWWSQKRAAGAQEAAELAKVSSPEAEARVRDINAWLKRTDPLKEQRARFDKGTKPKKLAAADVDNKTYQSLGWGVDVRIFIGFLLSKRVFSRRSGRSSRLAAALASLSPPVSARRCSACILSSSLPASA